LPYFTPKAAGQQTEGNCFAGCVLVAGGSSTGLPAPTLVDRPRLFRGWQNTHGDGRLIAGYDYHDQASYNEMAYANGLTTRLDYDTLGRTTRPSSAVADYRYGYDDAGTASTCSATINPTSRPTSTSTMIFTDLSNY
jgi:hypothetical protein